jgi:hypothetical protein
MAYETDTAKIDSVPAKGLAGVEGSLAYFLQEIENHIHTNMKYFGLAASPNGEIHRADRITLKPSPFVVDAGNDDWGAWLQILGSDDTPVVAGNTYYDFNIFLLVARERSFTPHFIQIACCESANLAAKIAAEEFTEVGFVSGGVAATNPPAAFNSLRIAAGTKIWTRLWIPDVNTGTADFYFSLHEYPG